jgi:DNA polymerase-3 subunit gamma/tau
LNTTTPSIKALKAVQDAEQVRRMMDQENMPKNPYTFESFMEHWKMFAFQIKERGQDTFYNALIRRNPIQEGNQFTIEVDNQIQIDIIQANLEEMVTYFREQIRNFEIDIQAVLTDKPEQEVKFLSGKDKFAALTRKNPVLHTLKSTFSLDIEF